MADSLSSKTLRRINKEVNSLRTQPPEGIRVLINEDDITDLKAWIHGPAETPYHNGYFKISIRFGPEYPSAPPNCIFATKIFHPNVGPKGEICVNTLKKDWTSSQTLTDILTVVKCLLIYPNPESALDEEAGRLLLENYDEYHQRAKLWTDIHAKNKPIGLFDSDESDTTATTTAGAGGDSKLTTLPFASSNQLNNNQASLSGTTTTVKDGPEMDEERLMKANSILNSIDGENLIPASLNHTGNPKQTHPNPTSNPKDKDRRGRKRL
ncbi:hypothetical protein PTTG_05577 [Puccinia triticina 1-1 BBBD Race 1]|uniref:E2 ubiquitin-conjugating enzyme n=2 Tax=Puccinia triticina TaxID=208348 RepID=A0A0C4EXM8_PUCT1|nr:uncharacterized protein PtA15_11A49 [Puccinia triticina]OAV93241.1 hypothetical protein PTTG_05577 [Puccinia triticina 1-1 BBBD Race 1]WAQ89362.1 hypothetical protein PtA15_11A49 [Puccinia triticina]WAR59411.1 hypothetical protein PtB15_11B51 [Puccinia triticina]